MSAEPRPETTEDPDATRGWHLRNRDRTMREGFVMLPNSIAFHPTLSSEAKVVWGTLQHYEWIYHHYPGHTRLAKDLHAGTRTVARHIEELVAAGLVTKTSRGAGATNTYELSLPEPTSKSDRTKMADPAPAPNYSGEGSAKNGRSDRPKMADPTYIKTVLKPTTTVVVASSIENTPPNDDDDAVESPDLKLMKAELEDASKPWAAKMLARLAQDFPDVDFETELEQFHAYYQTPPRSWTKQFNDWIRNGTRLTTKRRPTPAEDPSGLPTIDPAAPATVAQRRNLVQLHTFLEMNPPPGIPVPWHRNDETDLTYADADAMLQTLEHLIQHGAPPDAITPTSDESFETWIEDQREIFTLKGIPPETAERQLAQARRNHQLAHS